MSTGVLPDMYRHTARKSTVSKPLKAPTAVVYQHSTEAYTNGIQPSFTSASESIECHIKVEENLVEPFVLLPENEIEQMIIDEHIDRPIEDTLDEIIDRIELQLSPHSSHQQLADDDQIRERASTDTQDARCVMHSILTHFDENDPHEDNQKIDPSLDERIPMESEQQSSIISYSSIESDIEEMPARSNDTPSSSPSCTCQCHMSSSLLTNEYVLFEQALKQTRKEQEQERSLNKNRLLQTLKRQHEELLSLYQQSKSSKPHDLSRTDREQQTIRLHSNDSQIQTDFSTTNSTAVSGHKSIPVATTNGIVSHTTNGPLTATRNHSTGQSAGPSLQQVRPRLSTNATVTTVAPKTSTVTSKPAVTSTTPSVPSPTPALPAGSHDVVDLTEEDDEDDQSRETPSQRTAPIRQSVTSTQAPASSIVATATRIRPINRTIRPNNVLPSAQTFPLRPLPEHVPHDQSIARPQLSITQENATVRLTWNLPSTAMEAIQNYEIYAYKQTATVTTSDWKKIGTVKSMRLPMAVTLKEFQSNSHYAFAVRAVSVQNHIGPFCEPKTIFTGNPPVQPLHTSQLLNVSST